MRGKVVWKGDHLRLVLTATDSKGVTKEQVSQISSILRKIGCRCVLNEPKRVVHKTGQLVCSNRFEPLFISFDSEYPCAYVIISREVSPSQG